MVTFWWYITFDDLSPKRFMELMVAADGKENGLEGFYFCWKNR